MKFLIILLFSLNVSATFLGVSEVGVCNDPMFVIDKPLCEQVRGESCVYVGTNYNCNYFVIVTNDVNGEQVSSAVIDTVKKANYDAAQATIEVEKAKIEAGKINMAKCDEALAYLSGNNAGKTEVEVDAMALLFADIYEALKSHRRDKAARLITEKTIAAELEPLRTKLLEILDI